MVVFILFFLFLIKFTWCLWWLDGLSTPQKNAMQKIKEKTASCELNRRNRNSNRVNEFLLDKFNLHLHLQSRTYIPSFYFTSKACKK